MIYNNKKQVLFFTEIPIFPIEGGAQIRSYGLIKALSSIGYTVFVIFNNKNNIDISNYSLTNVVYMPYQPCKYNIMVKVIDILFGFRSFIQDRYFISIFDCLLQKKSIEIAYIDYGFYGQYIEYFKNRNIKVIYGTHNAQADLLNQVPFSNLFRYLQFKRDVFLAKYHERHYFKKADRIIVVSQNDYEYHGRFVAKDKMIIIPNFLDESLYNHSGNIQKGDYFIMTASFGASMNFLGLKWFLCNVWDKELSFQNRLLLVGNGSKEALLKIGFFENVEALGRVEDVKPYILKAKASLVPLMHGSGSRLKILESMALGVNVISTTKGAEGISSNYIEIADNPIDFKEKMKRYVIPHKYNVELYEDFIKKYSLKAVKKDLENMMISLYK